jgi:hypothetical protein
MMNEKISEMAPESEEPKGGVPQGVADDIAVLAAEIRAAERRAATGWKVTALVWVIILVVIASYLYALVYKPLKEQLEPETLVQMGITTATDALKANVDPSMPNIDSPQMAGWLATKLETAAPQVMQEHVKPQLLDLQARLPELRAQYAADIRRRAPELMEQGLRQFENEMLPQASDYFVSWLDTHLDQLMTQVDQDLQRAVGEMLVDVTRDVETLDQVQVMRERLRMAFEDAMGPVMDEMFEGLDQKVADVRGGMEELIDDYQHGRLSHKEKLEIRLVQLVRELFRGAAAKPSTEPGIIDELQGLLSDLEMPEATRTEILRGAARPGPMPDLSGVPAELRDKVRTSIEDARRRAAPAAAPAPAPAEALPPEAIEARERARREAEAAAAAAPEPEMTPEGRKAKEEALKKAREAAAEAARSGRAAAPAAPAPAEELPPEAIEAREKARKEAEAAAKAAAAAAPEREMTPEAKKAKEEALKKAREAEARARAAAEAAREAE